jgi:hypothetical protein
MVKSAGGNNPIASDRSNDLTEISKNAASRFFVKHLAEVESSVIRTDEGSSDGVMPLGVAAGAMADFPHRSHSRVILFIGSLSLVRVHGILLDVHLIILMVEQRPQIPENLLAGR